MTGPTHPDGSRVVPASLLGSCLMSIAAAGAALPSGLRLYSLSTGSTALPTTAAAVAIAAGAALGSAGAWGAAAERWRVRAGRRRHLALVTASLAFALALSPLLFMTARAACLPSWPLLGKSAAVGWALRLILAAALFSPPAIVLAGLLRTLSRVLDEGFPGDAAGGAFSFGLGAAGLALGMICGGGVLLPVLGMKGAFLVALALAGFGASCAVLFGRSAPDEEPAADEAGTITRAAVSYGSPRAPRRILHDLSTFLIGFALWGSFVCWSRTLHVLLGPTERTATVAGSILLGGLAIGSFLMAGVAAPPRPLVAVALMSLSPLLVYLSMFLVPRLATFYLRLAPGYAAGFPAAVLSVVVCSILILPAALLQGAVLGGHRVVAGWSWRDRDASSRDGSPLPLALIGGLFAAVATPLLLVPAFGLRRSLSLAAAVALLAVVFRLAEASILPPPARGTAIVVLLGAMVLMGAFPASWDPRIVGAGLYRYAAGAPERFGSSESYLEGRLKGRAPLAYREGREACVVVEPVVQAVPELPAIEALVLSLDGRSAANTGSDLRTQILTGEIPLLLHGPTDSVLLVDFLTGVTAGSILRHPVRSLTVIEREPAVLEAGALFGEAANHPLGDARLKTLIDSPRSRLLVDSSRYDVIVLPATDPWLPHTAALITMEGYDLLRRRLQPHGLLAQRLSLATADEPTLRTLLRTFARAFASVTVFQLTPDDLLLIGSETPLQLNAGWLSNVTSSNASVADDLGRAVVVGPNEIVMALRLGGDALRRLTDGGPLNDDDRSIVQVAAVRDLSVHRNDGLLRAIDGAWEGYGPLLQNYGATREAQAAFLYGLAKSILGLTTNPARALEVARELSALGETARSRWVTGEALLQQKDFDGAVREWESVLDVDPDNLDALFSLGTFHLDVNDFEEADRFLSQAVRRHPDVAVVRYHHGRTQFHLGRYEAAIAELRKARDLTPGRQPYPLTDYLVGLSASRLGRDAEAAQALQDYLKWAYEQSILTLVEVDAHLKLAEVLNRQGKRFEALRQRQKADQLRERIGAYARMQQQGSGGASGGNPPEAPPAVPPTAPAAGQAPPESDGR